MDTRASRGARREGRKAAVWDMLPGASSLTARSTSCTTSRQGRRKHATELWQSSSLRCMRSLLCGTRRSGRVRGGARPPATCTAYRIASVRSVSAAMDRWRPISPCSRERRRLGGDASAQPPRIASRGFRRSNVRFSIYVASSSIPCDQALLTPPQSPQEICRQSLPPCVLHRPVPSQRLRCAAESRQISPLEEAKGVQQRIVRQCVGRRHLVTASSPLPRYTEERWTPTSLSFPCGPPEPRQERGPVPADADTTDASEDLSASFPALHATCARMGTVEGEAIDP